MKEHFKTLRRTILMYVCKRRLLRKCKQVIFKEVDEMEFISKLIPAIMAAATAFKISWSESASYSSGKAARRRENQDEEEEVNNG